MLIGFMEPYGAWFKYASMGEATAQTNTTGLGSWSYQSIFLNKLAIYAYNQNHAPYWGVNPAKTIDGVWMFQASMQVDF